MTEVDCPDQATLKQLLLNQISGPRAEELEEHLLHCETCIRAAETLADSDGLTAAMREAKDMNFDEDTDPALVAAMQRACELRPHVETLETDETLSLDQRQQSGPPLPETTSDDAQLDPGDFDEPLDFLHPPQEPDELGRLGGYRILQVMGVGGMGVVFRAEDPKLKRQIALKVMKPSAAASRSAKNRFLREAQATAAIEHDHIVSIFQVGEDGNVPFIAMQYLRGESLQTRLKREGQLDQQEVLRIGREVASGLTAAHEQGLIHRDIKPDNIWMDEATGRAKVLDFGLARTAKDDSGLTRSGTVMGTPRYMAPEQAQAGEVDHRSDLFSLGSVLYHLASGRPPFKGGNITATLIAVAHEQQQPIATLCPKLHPEFCALVRGLLAKDPARRPQSAAEVAERLAAIELNLQIEQAQSTAEVIPPAADLAALPETVKLKTPEVSPAPHASRRRTLPVAVALGLFAALVAAAVFTFQTPSGTVEIEIPEGVDAKDISVAALQGGKVIEVADAANGWKIRLEDGKYQLELRGGQDNVKLDDHSVTVTRRDQKRVSIHYTPPGAPQPPGAGSKAPDSEQEPPVAAVQPADVGTKPPIAWQPGPPQPGSLIPQPAEFPGIHRWHLAASKHVSEASLSPDGKHLATYSKSGFLRVMDLDTGLASWSCRGGGSWQRGAAWSPDSKWIATSESQGAEQVVRLMQVGTSTSLTLKGHTGYIRTVAWSPEGTWVASGGDDKTVRLWQLDGTPGPVLQGHTDHVQAVTWSPDGKWIASASKDKTVRLWQIDGTAGPVFAGHTAIVNDVDWSPDGKLLASVGRDYAARIWQPDGVSGPVIEISGDRIVWSPNSSYLAVAKGLSGGTAFDIYSKEGRRVTGPCSVSRYHLSSLIWSPDSKRICVAASDLTVKWFDINGKLGPAYKLPVVVTGGGWNHNPVAWTPDGTSLALGCLDGTVRVLAATGMQQRLLQSPVGNMVHGPPVKWSPDGRWLAVGEGSADSKLAVQLWGSDGVKGPSLATKERAFIATTLAWSPDSRWLARGDAGGRIRIWEVDGTRGPVLAAHESMVSGLAWSPSGDRLASVSGNDKFLRFWQPDGTPGLSKELDNPAHAVAWSPDGQQIATLNVNNIQIWQSELKLVRSIPVGGTINMAWTHDWSRVAVGSPHGGGAGGAGGAVYAADGRLQAKLQGAVWHLAWDRSGEQLAAVIANGNGINALQVFHTPQGKVNPQWVALPFSDGETLVFSPAGQLLHGPDDVDRHVTYVVEKPTGKLETMTHVEFLQRTTLAAHPRAVKCVLDLGGTIKLANEDKVWTDDDVQTLDDLPQIDREAEVDLHDNQHLDDAAVALIVEMPHLARLDLSGTRLTSNGLKHLTALTHAKHLDFSNTSINSAGLAYLTGLTKLETLALRNTRIFGIAVGHLRQLKTLKHLDLRDTDFVAAEIEELKKALPDCQILTGPSTKR